MSHSYFKITYSRKQFNRTVKIEEYYINKKLNSYTETIQNHKEKDICKFSINGKIVERNIIYYNTFGQEFKKDVWVDNLDGTSDYKCYLLPHVSYFGDMEVIYKDYTEEDVVLHSVGIIEV